MYNKVNLYTVIILLLVLMSIGNTSNSMSEVFAKEINIANTPIVDLSKSEISVSPIFSDYQKTVDENIYNSMTVVGEDFVHNIYKSIDTPMLKMFKETINPAMAFATTWGEAGSSYSGVSLTTIMDFNPDTYISSIDWISVSSKLEQVDSSWYIVNSLNNYNTNKDGEAYRIPISLLQISNKLDRSINTMTDLGVGPYQITSPNWSEWDLDNRVSPILGWESSIKKCGTYWLNSEVVPISDLTVYACLSLGHQGGNLITMDFGKELINLINTSNIQHSINNVAYQMYLDAEEKASTKVISTQDIDVSMYVQILQDKTGINFSSYTGGIGSTNKGNYVIQHCLKYVFYKYYFTKGGTT